MDWAATENIRVFFSYGQTKTNNYLQNPPQFPGNLPSEKLVYEALDRLMARKTVITIAHRLSTIRSADVIFVIKDGRLVERGIHDELVREGGVYAGLERLQSGEEQSTEKLAS